MNKRQQKKTLKKLVSAKPWLGMLAGDYLDYTRKLMKNYEDPELQQPCDDPKCRSCYNDHKGYMG